MNTTIRKGPSVSTKEFPVSSASSSDELGYDAFSDELRFGIGGNSANPFFFDLLNGISRLKGLPEEHAFHVNADIADRASKVLAYLYQNYGVSLPKLLPEDAERLSLTWDDGVTKRYLSLTDDAVDLTLIDRRSDESSYEALSEGEEVEFDRVGEALSPLGRANSRTFF